MATRQEAYVRTDDVRRQKKKETDEYSLSTGSIVNIHSRGVNAANTVV